MLPTNYEFLTQLGFEIIERLGVGTHAVTYKVRSKDNLSENNLSVVKLMLSKDDPHIADTAASYREKLAHILHEREALERAKDIEGVTKLIDYHEHINGVGPIRGFLASVGWYQDRVIALRKESFEGENPASREKLVQPETRESLVKTVEDLHATGLTAGDLKPDNLLITPEGKPYILDLGSSIFAGEQGFEAGKIRDLTNLEILFGEMKSYSERMQI